MKKREGLRSAGNQQLQLKSAEPNIGKQEKLKLYREPFQDDSANHNALEKLKEYKQRAMLLAYGGVHESQTPAKEGAKPVFLISQQNSQKYLLPPIQSTKASDIIGKN